ncbi:noncanonical pyrimidine nucleotidase, YjjG family [Pseudoalteromonas aurantia]|uniref:pyrimidine 5'-nucleotidase n=1 Tax=Pseudoalteromonas aurantia TaxID=43654 RepID=UPI00110A6E96|nr:pyrimidine 5'-nucleotidase [Pseudoalteromonas aurantia]TMO61793.1 noncanonical pyrimidine nucleotidase, YjjG family [Pseudoalteromonas aurantia]
MKYTHILFDADETLFSFNACAGLQVMFAQYGVTFTAEHFTEYQQVNVPLWLDYQAGRIDAKTLQVTRFSSWASKLNVPAEQLNEGFLMAMAAICEPLPGARELLNLLQGKAKLGIITNGFAALQQRRLAHTGLTEHFEHLVISELVGIAKPDPKIFQHTLSLFGEPDKSKVLMVGDTPSSDILGANQFGIDSCWLQHQNQTCPADIKPTYSVRSLTELARLLAEE